MATPASTAHRLRPAGVATRAAILDAARELFAEHGFAETSVRQIGRAAGADPALVVRHFGSKEALFLQCLDHSANLAAVLDGPLETLGSRLVAAYLSQDRARTQATYLALVQASHLEQVREELARVNERVLIAPLAARLEGQDRELRASLVCAQLSGLLGSMHLSGEAALVEAETDALAVAYGPALQALINP